MTERLTAARTPDDPVAATMAAAAGLPSALSGGRWSRPEPIDLYWVFPRSFELVWLATARLEWSLRALLWLLGFGYAEPAALPVGWISAPDDWRPYTAPPGAAHLRAHPSNGPPAWRAARWSPLVSPP